MMGRIFLGLTCAMSLSLGQPGTRAQSSSQLAASEGWMHDFTVLTMSGDAWGAATDPGNRARDRQLQGDVRATARLRGLFRQYPGRLEPGSPLRARDHHRG